MEEDAIKELVDLLDKGEIDVSEYQQRLNEVLERASVEAKSSTDETLRKSRIRSSSRIARGL
jgi:hypothetical protein